MAFLCQNRDCYAFRQHIDSSHTCLTWDDWFQLNNISTLPLNTAELPSNQQQDDGASSLEDRYIDRVQHQTTHNASNLTVTNAPQAFHSMLEGLPFANSADRYILNVPTMHTEVRPEQWFHAHLLETGPAPARLQISPHSNTSHQLAPHHVAPYPTAPIITSVPRYDPAYNQSLLQASAGVPIAHLESQLPYSSNPEIQRPTLESHGTQPERTQSSPAETTAVWPAMYTNEDTATTSHHQDTTTKSWKGCRACFLGHEACRPGNDVKRPHRCKECIKKQRQGRCKEPIPELSFQQSVSFLRLASYFDACDMDEFISARDSPPHDPQVEIGTNDTRFLTTSLQCLRGTELASHDKDLVAHCVVDALGLAGTFSGTSAFSVATTISTKKDYLTKIINKHCAALFDALYLLCHPKVCTLKTTLSLQRYARSFVLLVCHQIYQHANNQLHTFFTKMVDLHKEIPRTSEEKTKASDVACCVGVVHKLLTSLKIKLQAWQRTELSSTELFPDLSEMLKTMELMGLGLGVKQFNTGRNIEIDPVSRIEVIVRPTNCGTSLKEVHIYGSPFTFPDAIGKAAQICLIIEDPHIEIYFPRDYLSKEARLTQLESYNHIKDDPIATDPVEKLKDEQMMLVIEKLQQNLACRQKHRRHKNQGLVHAAASNERTPMTQSRAQIHSTAQATPSSAKFSSSAPTIVGPDTDDDNERDAPDSSPSLRKASDISMADEAITEPAVPAVGLGMAPRFPTEGPAGDLYTARKRKMSVPLEYPTQSTSDAFHHEGSGSGKVQQPESTLPSKKSVAQRFLDKLKGPRLNPHGSNLHQMSIPEGPYDQQVYSNGLSHRPTTWPSSRKWRKSVGEATKNVNKPRPERDLAKEAQARSQALENFNHQVIPNLVKMGLLAKSKRSGRQVDLRE